MQKFGLYAAVGYSHSFEERLSRFKAAGFDIICLNFEKELESSETPWENQVKTARKLDLEIQSAHLTGDRMTEIWSDCDGAEYVTTRLICELERMASLGVPVGVAHVTWGHDIPPEPSASALARFERIAEAAQKNGVKIAFENSVFPRHLRFVLDNIKSDCVGFCYDSGHENAFTPNENYLSDYADRLFAMHLHDNTGNFDNHFPPYDPEGTINWDEKIALLNRSELFRKDIILEVGWQKKYGFDELLSRCYNSARRMAEASARLAK